MKRVSSAWEGAAKENEREYQFNLNQKSKLSWFTQKKYRHILETADSPSPPIIFGKKKLNTSQAQVESENKIFKEENQFLVDISTRSCSHFPPLLKDQKRLLSSLEPYTTCWYCLIWRERLLAKPSFTIQSSSDKVEIRFLWFIFFSSLRVVAKSLWSLEFNLLCASDQVWKV